MDSDILHHTFEYISDYLNDNENNLIDQQQPVVMAINQAISTTQVDYTSIILIMGSVFIVLFLLILITCAILRNSKRKYKFYQFQKREKQPREFDKEYFKSKASHWTVSNSVKAYSIQANEIFQNWKPPVFQLKALPHFAHLYVVSSSTNHPQCEGYVFYNNVRDSMGSSLSNISILNSSRVAAHQSTDLTELRKGILLERKPTSSTIAGASLENIELEFRNPSNVGISITTPPPSTQPIPPSTGIVQSSSTKILSQSTSQLNMANGGKYFSSLSKGNLNSSTGTVVMAEQNIDYSEELLFIL
ncbi:predicted protein [Naegleria gruberi]|uniref:Predicted protein n=1 Tax=Naegleria gruberi TaxID=5762 RepID=D2VQN1_NAEGR|nr:uncharacterized protein NAEGRDRAFT_71285 [Naegleria gruberi]EFC40978.1 predicted protein [Naegleria gruberi]|eukprot:XP_002673722.1 predicted protein [Naegleria gruberi strain NEG-M]